MKPRTLPAALTVAALCCHTTLYAQTERTRRALTADSTATDTTALEHRLQEVVVKGARLVRKSDKDVFYPSDEARSRSSNGLQLLQNLQVADLLVNTALNQIESVRGSVQLRINGREATLNEVKQLTPESIARVEHRSNPGMRYGGAQVVIDFVVRHRNSGGDWMLEQSVWSRKFLTGDTDAAIHLNKGRSQFGFSANYQQRNHLPLYREYNEHLTFADNTFIHKVEQQRGGSYNFRHLWSRATYSYVVPERLTLYVGAGFVKQPEETTTYHAATQTDGTAALPNTLPYHSQTSTCNTYHTPSLNLYLDRHWKGGHELAIDFTASLRQSHSESNYRETQADTSAPRIDIANHIKDRNATMGLVADYMKSWKSQQLTVGAKWNHYRNRAECNTPQDAVLHQDRETLNTFAEYSAKLGIFHLRAGASLVYDKFKLREENRGSETLFFKPQLTLGRQKGGSYLQLSAFAETTAPALNMTNPTLQPIDAHLVEQGNPVLTNYTTRTLLGTYSQQLGRLFTSLQAALQATSHNGIATTYTPIEGQRILRSWDNNNSLKITTARLSASYEAIPNWLSLSGSAQISHYRSSSNRYNHRHTTWNGHAQITAAHWGFNLTYQISQAPKELSGELLKQEESANLLNLSYNRKGWQVGTTLLMPFGKYKQHTELLNDRYRFKQVMRSNFVERIFTFNLSYRMNWGKQSNQVSKRANATSDNMQSKAAEK